MIYQRHISPDELLSTQLELVMQSGRLATIYSQLIGVTATLLLFWPYVEIREMLIWTAAVVSIMLMRWLFMNHALADYRYRCNPPAVLRQLILGAALSGAVWSTVYIFAADRAPPAVQYVFLLIVFIITALSVGVTVIIREYFIAFLFTSLWPIAWWSLIHYWQQPHNLLVGLGLLTVCALFVSLCDRVYQSYRNMIALNWERESMSRELGNLTGSLRDRNKQLQETRQQLTNLANVDELTGLGNRRLVNRVVEEEINRAKRSGAHLSLILLDVDCFKNYNDTYGHSAGDRVLVQLADVMRQSVSRAGEVVGRYGGEEFILILPGATASSAMRTASRLRDRVLAEKIPHCSSTVSEYVTISQGVMTVGADLALGPEELIDAADAALYQSKGAGRNAITVADTRQHCQVEASLNR